MERAKRARLTKDEQAFLRLYNRERYQARNREDLPVKICACGCEKKYSGHRDYYTLGCYRFAHGRMFCEYPGCDERRDAHSPTFCANHMAGRDKKHKPRPREFEPVKKGEGVQFMKPASIPEISPDLVAADMAANAAAARAWAEQHGRVYSPAEY